MPTPVDVYAWRQSIASERGPRNPQTRYVLLVLSLHMKSDGTGAWPSQRHLAARSGLNERVVRRHLALAERGGWLARLDAGRNGQGWRLTKYEAAAPDDVAAELPERPWGADPTWRREDSQSAPLASTLNTPAPERADKSLQTCGQERPNVRTNGPETCGPPVRLTLPLNNLSRTLPKTEGALASDRTPRLSDVERKTKIRALRSAGLGAGDIVRALSQFNVSHEEVLREGTAA